jgi:uncharacterized NAD(P)/FAD-binding protein YdhS
MRTAYELYQVAFVRHNHSEMTIEALNRKGQVFIAHLKRTDDRYWEGVTDFKGLSERKIFKGIVIEFLRDLVNEVREYDKRWYDLHCVVRCEIDGNRPLTWEETYGGGLINEDEPDFKGGVTFLVERYEQ